MLHEGLRHARVDRVVAHLVAHAVRAPAQRQLGQVARAQHDAAQVVGQAEQVVGAQARLDVLEGDIVRGLTLAVGVADVGQHLRGRRADVDLLEGRAQVLAQQGRVRLRALGRGETGQRVAQNVRARSPQQVHRAGSHDQRVRRIQAARDPDDDLWVADRAQALDQAGDLNVVGLVAVLLQARGVVGDEGEAVDRSLQAQVGARRIERDLDLLGGQALVPREVALCIVRERILALALGAQALQVHVGDRDVRALLEAFADRQAFPGLVNHGLAVPSQIRAGLAHAGRRVDVGRRAARGHRAHHEFAVRAASDRDRGRRQVRQDGRARECQFGGGSDGHPHVLADLDADGQAGHVVGGDEDLAEGDPHGAAGEFFDATPRDFDALAGARGHGDEVALLVELAVVGQVRLGNDREHAPAVDGDRAVVQGVVLAQRRADDEEGE